MNYRDQWVDCDHLVRDEQAESPCDISAIARPQGEKRTESLYPHSFVALEVENQTGDTGYPRL
jgi:hypothetical protein